MIFYEGGQGQQCVIHCYKIYLFLNCSVRKVKWVFPNIGEQHTNNNLSKKFTGEEKTFKEVRKVIGCSSNILSIALKWQQKHADES